MTAKNNTKLTLNCEVELREKGFYVLDDISKR